MNAFLIWYRSRPSDELGDRLRALLRTIDADILGENATINGAQVPSMLAASLRVGNVSVIVGGLDLLREEDNIVYILSRCLSLKLETGADSRSTYIYDPVRGSVLPSFSSAVLFPSAAGGPEGAVMVSGQQVIILLPWLDKAHMDMLDIIGEYLPELINESASSPKPAKPASTKKVELPHYIARHAIDPSAGHISCDEELTPNELRAMLAERFGSNGVYESNVDRPPQPPAPQREHARFTPHAAPQPKPARRAPASIPPLVAHTAANRFVPLYRTLAMLLIVTIIVSSCYIAYFYYESAMPGERVVYQSELAALYNDTGTAAGLPTGALAKFSQLYSENKSVSGYISIPGTDLSQPVLSPDPEKPDLYSGLDFYGDNDSHGSLYFSVGNTIEPDTENYNLVIFGNSPSDGSMFFQLQNYTDKDFLAAHPIINMDTLYEEARWVIFSVCIASGDTISEFNYANTEFIEKYSHQIHLYNLYIRSLFYTSTEVFADEDILTLVTDSPQFTGAKLLVCARKVREDEDLSYAGQNVVENDLVLMPDVWYKINDAVRPRVPELDLPIEDDPVPEETTTDADDGTTTTTADDMTTSVSGTTTATTTASTTAATTTTTTTTTAPTSSTEPSPGTDAPADTQPPTTTTTTGTNPTTAAPNTSVSSMRITSGGKVVTGSAAEVLAMIIEAEMGSGYSLEALKAQAVAAYTYYLYSGGSAKSPSFPTKTAGSRAKEAAKAVAGQYMSYNGNVPYTPYFAISAGRTANNKDINGANLSYLESVDCSVDESVSGYRKVVEVTPSEIAAKVKAKKGIDLTKIADKSQWFKVEQRDSNDLYVLKVNVGGTSYKGNTLHLSILGYSYLRSPCFWIEYDESRDLFILTSLGYGTGVGMSQKGANEYAGQGYNYVWILQHFYTGVSIKS